LDKVTRIVSGARASGLLHLGNYIGALSNWVRLQADYECFYFVANWHGLTTDYDNTGELRHWTREILIDFLAAGLDPEKSVLFVQSDVPEHAELHLMFSMVTPLSWLERVPTYKERLREQSTRDLATYGFLGYPCLQAADILLYKGDAVPVGGDQVSHLELTREIARRFNFFYGNVFPEPQVLLTEFPTLPGIDGRKMSKSYDNSIMLSASPEEVRKRVSIMITDPARIKRSDPGHPDVCTAYAFHKVFNPENAAALCEMCKKAEIGCVECKKNLGNILAAKMAPIYDKRMYYVNNPALVDEIRSEGARKARAVASSVMADVRQAMKI
jgi:tryptophanyl-tRNA synthetase